MSRRVHSSRSWDPVADWYIGWVGSKGSDHHRKLAIPAVLDLLGDIRTQQILDIGCGTAALAAHVVRRGGGYTGVDASRRLLAHARQHHRVGCRFFHGDATRLGSLRGLHPGEFDAAVFLLSIQDIDPLEDALICAARALRPGGRIVILMLHACFRVPRQSGWGQDPARRLRYRRVDSYLTPLSVPMKSYDGGRGATRSYHRPLQHYLNGLADCGLSLRRVCEIPASEDPVRGKHGRAERRVSSEIPLFMGLLAQKPAQPSAGGATNTAHAEAKW